MLDMTLLSMERHYFDKDANIALITVLSKPNKDTTFCGLDILNADIELYTKALPSRTDKHMTNLVYYDQTLFIQSCLAGDNIHRLLCVLHFSKASDTPCAVLSLH